MKMTPIPGDKKAIWSTFKFWSRHWKGEQSLDWNRRRGTASPAGRRTDSAYCWCNINAHQTWRETQKQLLEQPHLGVRTHNSSPPSSLPSRRSSFSLQTPPAISSGLRSVRRTDNIWICSKNFQLSWCPSLAIMFCHKARGECQERCEAPCLLRWVPLIPAL